MSETPSPSDDFRPEDLAPARVSQWIRKGPDVPPRGRRTLAGMFHVFTRVAILVFHETLAGRLVNRAAALTYTTILSLFPALVVMTAIASVFYTQEQENQLISFIEERFLPSRVDVRGVGTSAEADELEQRQEAVGSVTTSIRAASKSFRDSAGNVGLVGFLGLFIAAGLLYKSTEDAMDAVWKAPRRRPFLRTLGAFSILVVFAPIVLGLSVSASSFVVRVISEGSRQVAHMTSGGDAGLVDSVGKLLESHPADSETSTTASVVAPVDPMDTGIYNFQNARRVGSLGYLLPLIPPILNGMFLTLAYIMLPQAKVRFRSALVGGLIGGFLWELAKVFFLYYAFSSDVRRQLFKTMGVVPLFLIWIYFTWLVFLLGSEIAFVVQNFERLCEERWEHPGVATLDGRLILVVALLVADDFRRGRQGTTLDSLRQRLGLTLVEVDEALALLLQKKMLLKTDKDAYVPGYPAAQTRVGDLLLLGTDPRELLTGNASRHLLDRMAPIQQRVVEAGGDLTLEDLMADGRPIAD